MADHNDAPARGDPPRLLFVCVENSCRSQMAEGFARKIGGGRIAAFSAGSHPSGAVHPSAIRLMKEKGIDLTTHASKGLDDLPPQITWDWIVTIGCGDACPHLPARRRVDWELPAPKGMSDEDFRRLRDRIESLVLEVVEQASSADRGDEGAERRPPDPARP